MLQLCMLQDATVKRMQDGQSIVHIRRNFVTTISQQATPSQPIASKLQQTKHTVWYAEQSFALLSLL